MSEFWKTVIAILVCSYLWGQLGTWTESRVRYVWPKHWSMEKCNQVAAIGVLFPLIPILYVPMSFVKCIVGIARYVSSNFVEALSGKLR